MNIDLLLPIMGGVLLALPFVVVAHYRSTRAPLMVAIGLVVAAVVYVALAASTGSSEALLLELGGLSLFALLAAGGLRLWLPLLALGWALHVTWDLYFHPVSSPSYAPSWYPLLCVGFDIFVAGYALSLAPGRSKNASRLLRRVA